MISTLDQRIALRGTVLSAASVDDAPQFGGLPAPKLRIGFGRSNRWCGLMPSARAASLADAARPLPRRAWPSSPPYLAQVFARGSYWRDNRIDSTLDQFIGRHDSPAIADIIKN